MKKRSGLFAAVAIASTLLVTAPAYATTAPPPDPAVSPDSFDPRGPEIPLQPAPALPTAENVSCTANVQSVTPDGDLVEYSYGSFEGVGTMYTHVWGDQLGYVPRAFARSNWAIVDPAEPTNYQRHWFATSPDGKLNDVRLGLDATLPSTPLNPTWKAVRNLNITRNAGDGDYLYGLNDDGNFYRYTYRWDQVGAPSARVTIGGSGWGKVKTLSVTDRNVPGVDTFVGTTTDGKLAEYSISRANPSQVTSKVLRPDSWHNIVSLNAGQCWTYNDDGTSVQNQGGVMVGTTANGDAYLYFDKNWNDGSGADIVALGKIASGWTGKNYSN